MELLDGSTTTTLLTPIFPTQLPHNNSTSSWMLNYTYDRGSSGEENRSLFPILLAALREGINSTPNTMNFDEEDEEEDTHIFDKPSVRITLGILYTIVFCFCVLGNLSVILVVTLHWKMRSIAKFCMGNLACANLCVGVFCVFQNLSTYLTDRWLFGNFLCKMYYFTTSWAQAASILILVLTCVERYLVILHPFKCRQFLTMRKLRYIVAGIWLLSAGISSPKLYYINTILIPIYGKDDELRSEVICIARQTMYNSPAADMAYFIVLYLLPLAIMGILYSRLGIFLSRADSMLRMGNNGVSSSYPHPPLGGRDALGAGNGEEAIGNGMSSGREYRKTSHSESSGCSGSSETSEDRRRKRISRRKKKKERKKKIDSARYGDGPNVYSDDCSEETEMGDLSLKVKAGDEGEIVGGGAMPGGNNMFSRESSNRSSAKGKDGLVRRAPPIISRKRTGSRRAVVRMLIVIVLTFALCNLPFHVRKLCQNHMANYSLESDWSHLFAVSTFLMMYANCAVNPILYAFMSQSFRESFKDLMFCKWRKRFVRNSNYSV